MSFPSPLHESHSELGAKMVDFAGWEMPLQYEGIVAEQRAVRTAAGIFDVSHLGKIVVEGAGAAGWLDGLLPGKVGALETWTAGYNLVLDESGGIVDDVFVLRLPAGFLIVPNAANMDAVLDWLQAQAGPELKVVDARRTWAIIALSGPLARDIIGPLAPKSRALGFHRLMQAQLGKIPVYLARTGYTGEVTFEIFVDWGFAAKVWDRLLEAGRRVGLKPAGLGARDLLRLEMGYPLHGRDISTDTNPIEAGLDWVIEWDKDFVGKAALQKIRGDGPHRRLTGLVGMSRRIPRSGSPLIQDGITVGEVTSGNYSPSLGAGIALGYVTSDLATEWTVLEADLGRTTIPVRVTKPPFLPGR